jgi:hypothetical protein
MPASTGSAADAEESMTTAQLIAKLKGDDPDGVREIVIWDNDDELVKGVARVELSDDRVVVHASRWNA